jgi:hypothetical protein
VHLEPIEFEPEVDSVDFTHLTLESPAIPTRQ